MYEQDNSDLPDITGDKQLIGFAVIMHFLIFAVFIYAVITSCADKAS